MHTCPQSKASGLFHSRKVGASKLVEAFNERSGNGWYHRKHLPEIRKINLTHTKHPPCDEYISKLLLFSTKRCVSGNISTRSASHNKPPFSWCVPPLTPLVQQSRIGDKITLIPSVLPPKRDCSPKSLFGGESRVGSSSQLYECFVPKTGPQD